VDRGSTNPHQNYRTPDHHPVSLDLTDTVEKRRLGQALIVLTTTGEAYRFSGLGCDKWLADLGAALSRTGRQVSPTTVGLVAA